LEAADIAYSRITQEGAAQLTTPAFYEGLLQQFHDMLHAGQHRRMQHP
jgi:hypothetical protein